MTDYLELIDVYKALLALAAGIILGLERELKDKAAGLKTITIICLGSALFTILSQKVGGEYTDSSRIASYIVSGIGFLGAGVIFKDGVNVQGLTTASVIWLAAAIGMSIGFGEIYIAGVFLAISMIVIFAGTLLNNFFPSAEVSKLLSLTIKLSDLEKRQQILQSLDGIIERREEKKIMQKGDQLILIIEITIDKDKLEELQECLVQQRDIVEFEL